MKTRPWPRIRPASNTQKRFQRGDDLRAPDGAGGFRNLRSGRAVDGKHGDHSGFVLLGVGKESGDVFVPVAIVDHALDFDGYNLFKPNPV